MKFELEPYNRGVPSKDILDDVRFVAARLQRDTLTIDEYRKYGRYSPDLARRRFGTWFKVLAEAGLNKSRNLNVSSEECIADLKEVSQRLGTKKVTTCLYDENGKFSSQVFYRRFGTWFRALEIAGLERTRNFHVTDEEYFENLERIWVTLGRQPHYSDIQKPLSRYSAGAYEYRFGTWRKALESFVNFINAVGSSEIEVEATVASPSSSQSSNAEIDEKAVRLPRNISWRLRFLVMRRDNFRCCACGRSPVTHTGVALHVDHIKAWAKGGETAMDNLQTLCEHCNIGKSDLEMMDVNREPVP